MESPSDEDLALAVQFGLYARQRSGVVQSAYISRIELTGASVEPFHIVIRTPLYLISRHVMERDASNQPVDPKFVDFARHLGFVQLAISKTTITSETWRDYVLDREMILFRDGERVPPAASVPAWNAADPFEDLNDPLESWRSTSWLRRGVEEMQEDDLRTTEETADDQTHPSRAARVASGWVQVQPGAAVFPVEELRKPGRYEIVFRRSPGSPAAAAAAATVTAASATTASAGTGTLTPVTPAEIRLPISFATFR